MRKFYKIVVVTLLSGSAVHGVSVFDGLRTYSHLFKQQVFQGASNTVGQCAPFAHVLKNSTNTLVAQMMARPGVTLAGAGLGASLFINTYSHLFGSGLTTQSSTVFKVGLAGSAFTGGVMGSYLPSSYTVPLVCGAAFFYATRFQKSNIVKVVNILEKDLPKTAGVSGLTEEQNDQGRPQLSAQTVVSVTESLPDVERPPVRADRKVTISTPKELEQMNEQIISDVIEKENYFKVTVELLTGNRSTKEMFISRSQFNPLTAQDVIDKVNEEFNLLSADYRIVKEHTKFIDRQEVILLILKDVLSSSSVKQ